MKPEKKSVLQELKDSTVILDLEDLRTVMHEILEEYQESHIEDPEEYLSNSLHSERKENLCQAVRPRCIPRGQPYRRPLFSLTFRNLKKMEFINRIDLQGVVGSVKITPVGDTRVARFSVCTETTYKGTAGIVIDCCWFQVSAWESEKISCLEQIEKGKAVRVSGRVRVQRYTDNEGIERQCWEVMAREVELMKED